MNRSTRSLAMLGGWVLALTSAVAQTVFAASLGQTTLRPSGEDGPVTVYYASEGPEQSVRRGRVMLQLAVDAPADPGNGRLVVISHGSGGSPWVHADLARALVNAGFVVAVPEHHADNYLDDSKPGPDSWTVRPAEVSRAIDAVGRDVRFAPLLQLDKVGVYGMGDAGKAPALLIGHSLGGAAVLAAAAELPNVKAIATIGAPCDVHHVTRLFGEDLKTLLEQGEAEVKLGGRPFKMRRSFVDDLSSHDQKQRIGSLRRALLVMHAPTDRTVDIDNAAQIFLAAKHPKSFVSLDSADHLLTRSTDSAYAAEVISAWATRYLGKAPPRSAREPGQVVVEETGEGDFQVEVLAGEVRFLADEPVEVGGMGSGPTPYDLLCAALGAWSSRRACS